MIFDPAFRLSERLKPPSLGAGCFLGLTDGAGAARPTFALNFLTGDTLDPRVSFARDSVGTRINSAGLIESVGIDVPRFEYDPTTLQPKGLLVEDQRTNLLTYSAQIDNAAWSVARGTVSANTAIAPDGATSGDGLVEDSTNNSHPIFRTVANLTNATAYTASVFVKAVGRAQVRVAFANTAFSAGPYGDFDLSTVSAVGSSGGSATIVPLNNGWYRCIVSAISGAVGSGDLFIQPLSGGNGSYVGNGGTALVIWGAQLEAGSFATSYIPTAASTVTRSADKPVMAGTSFTSAFNPGEGTFFVEVNSPNLNVGGNKAIFATHDNVGPLNFIQSYVSSDLRAFVQIRAGGVDEAQFYANSHLNNAASGVALAYAANDVAQSVNGSVPSTDTSVIIPSAQVRVAIGWAEQYGGLSINGCVQRLDYYNHRLPNADLRRISA